MAVESVADLKAAFEEWRSRKTHAREAIPTALLERACAAARHHGPAAVSRATKVDRGRLSRDRRGRATREAGASSVPPYSRLEVEAPAAETGPFAELEMPTGMKVRLFAQTEQTLALVSALCGTRGAS